MSYSTVAMDSLSIPLMNLVLIASATAIILGLLIKVISMKYSEEEGQ